MCTRGRRASGALPGDELRRITVGLPQLLVEGAHVGRHRVDLGQVAVGLGCGDCLQGDGFGGGPGSADAAEDARAKGGSRATVAHLRHGLKGVAKGGLGR